MDNPINFGPLDDHARAVLARIDAETARLAQQRANVETRLRDLARVNDVTPTDATDDALRAFLAKPYFVRAIGNQQYELTIPRFLNFRAGWPVRVEDAWTTFLVTRFSHMLAPLPAWLADDLGYHEPTWRGVIEGNTLTVTRGNPQTIARELGKGIARIEGNRLTLKPASRFDIIRRIIREHGFIPHAPRPLAPDLLRDPNQFVARVEDDERAYTLRPHQQKTFDDFLQWGSTTLIAWGQSGKSFVGLEACAALRGRKLILVPRRSIRDQWLTMRLPLLTPDARNEIVVDTYHNLRKYQDTEWVLVIADEAHHLPANLFIESAMLKTVAFIGATATPVREDQNEDLIFALCGAPSGAEWPIAETQRPTVTVWLERDEDAKLARCRRLLEKQIRGKTFVFVQRLAIGKRVARALDAPFVSGETSDPLQVLTEHDLAVVSSVGDAGLSQPVDRIIEIDFLGSSRMQAGQRALRLAYDTGRKSELHVLMTPDEFTRFGSRLEIYERWGLDVTLESGEGRAPTLGVVASRSARRASVRTATPRARVETPEPSDDIARTLARAPLAAKVRAVEARVERKYYVRVVLRACWNAALAPQDLALGLGTNSPKTIERIRQCCRALAQEKLLLEDAKSKTFRVNQDEIHRLAALAELSQRARLASRD